MEQTVPITNGVGSLELSNGTYAVASSTLGYDDTSITPAEQEIVDGTDEYSFTIAATGTLTLHVSDDGTDAGVPIEGAKFVRCDADGNTYGDEVLSDADGNAVFGFVPFAEENAPAVYYKQTASDGTHEFSIELQNTSLSADAVTVEVANTPATLRTFNLTDANYTGLPIADGQINLTQ